MNINPHSETVIVIVALFAIAISFSAGFILGIWKGVRDERKEVQSLKKPYSRPERPLRVVRDPKPHWSDYVPRNGARV